MRARVTRAYTDRIDGTLHCLGTTVDLSEDRLAELSARGFVEAMGDVPVPDTDGPAADLSGLTVAELRGLIAERGGKAPKRATKARLVEIAGAL